MEVKDYQWHHGASGHYFATVHTIHSSQSAANQSGWAGGFSLGHVDFSPLARLPLAWLFFCLFCVFVAWFVTRPRSA